MHFEESFWTFAAPVRLVLKDLDTLFAVLSAGIGPHPGFLGFFLRGGRKLYIKLVKGTLLRVPIQIQ